MLSTCEEVVYGSGVFDKNVTTVSSTISSDSNGFLHDIDWRESLKPLKSKLEFTLTHELFTDLTCIVGQGVDQEIIKCHSLLLRINSKSFNEEFVTTNLKSHLELQHYTPIAFKNFLTFLYTEKFHVSVDEGILLLGIAKDFQVTPLVEECSKLLREQIDISNSCQIYGHAIKCQEKKLQTFARDFILRNAGEVFRTQGFFELPHACLEELLASFDKNIDEVSAFNSMIRWAKARCEKENLELSSSNLKFVLQECPDLINYEQFTAAEFSEHVVDTEILPQNVALQILKKLNLNQGRSSTSPLNSSKLPLTRVSSSTSSSGISTSSEPSSPLLEQPASQEIIQTQFKVNRYKHIRSQAWLSPGISRLTFMCHKPIKISGVGIFGCSSTSNVGGDVTPINVSLTLATYDEMAQIASMRKLFPASNEGGVLRCFFETPVTLEGKQWYTLIVDMSGEMCPFGIKTKKKVNLHLDSGKETMTIEFKNPKAIANGSSSIYSKGQFPEFHFSL